MNLFLIGVRFTIGVLLVIVGFFQSKVKACFWITVIGCGIVSDALHKLRDYGHFKAMTSFPKPPKVLCRNCGHVSDEHIARKMGVTRERKPILDWICYGSDDEGISCACAGFDPEVQ